jgi:hypothetical protein
MLNINCDYFGKKGFVEIKLNRMIFTLVAQEPQAKSLAAFLRQVEFRH